MNTKQDDILGLIAVFLFLGLMLAAPFLQAYWAYGDWTCMFKTCIVVMPEAGEGE